ncbi:MAG: 50S ribosomal protein L18 [Spirochaetota bacterium]
MDRLALKKKRFTRRRLSIKNKVRKDLTKLRLCISKSNKNFYAQIIDDQKGHTLVALSTLSKDYPVEKNKGNIESAKTLGKLVAEKAKAKGISAVVFDRNGYLYHGKVKAFADSARENGLEF